MHHITHKCNNSVRPNICVKNMGVFSFVYVDNFVCVYLDMKISVITKCIYIYM